MKKILLIDQLSAKSTLDSLKDLLEFDNEDISVSLATDESTATDVLLSKTIHYIIIQPMLGTGILIKNEAKVENVLMGGTGLVLLANLDPYIKIYDTKIIVLSSVPREDLLKVGFSEKYCFLRRPVSYQDIVAEII